MRYSNVLKITFLALLIHGCSQKETLYPFNGFLKPTEENAVVYIYKDKNEYSGHVIEKNIESDSIKKLDRIKNDTHSFYKVSKGNKKYYVDGNDEGHVLLNIKPNKVYCLKQAYYSDIFQDGWDIKQQKLYTCEEFISDTKSKIEPKGDFISRDEYLAYEDIQEQKYEYNPYYFDLGLGILYSGFGISFNYTINKNSEAFVSAGLLNTIPVGYGIGYKYYLFDDYFRLSARYGTLGSIDFYNLETETLDSFFNLHGLSIAIGTGKRRRNSYYVDFVYSIPFNYQEALDYESASHIYSKTMDSSRELGFATPFQYSLSFGYRY